MQWIIDGSIHLSEICVHAGWKWQQCIDDLVAAGLLEVDAATFAGWAFGSDAMYQRAIGDESLTSEQYARISIRASGGGMHPAPPNL